MKLIPAIDLKDNKCIRLTKGKEKSAKPSEDKAKSTTAEKGKPSSKETKKK